MAQGSETGTRTILVIEDDPVVRKLLDHMFRRRGYGVQSAVDGRAACTMIDELAPPSLVVLDIVLPYVNGFELIERIRSRPEWAAVPIIMLTAKAQERNVVRALDAGANDYIVKPFKPAELIARVRRFVG